MKAVLGRKLGMTQLFDEDGNVSRVTVVEAAPCVVTQVKTEERDGYAAVQIGTGKHKRPAKPQMAAKGNTPRHLREVRMDDAVADVESVEGEEGVKVGDKVDLASFEAGDAVQVTGISKGKGFAGTVKRHNFNTGPKSHGSRNYREPGSIGGAYPQKIFKGIKMAGQMGNKKVTVKGLKVVHIDVDNNLLSVSGAIPGPRKGLVLIKGAK